MMAISLEESVKTELWLHYINADKALQQINLDLKTQTPSKKVGTTGHAPEFTSAVLAEYRLIRPKLDYINKITKDEAKRTKFKGMRDALDPLCKTNDCDWKALVDFHLLVGEFLELDGVSKFEREVPDLSTIMVQ